MDRTELLDRYRRGFAAVEQALEDITEDELDRPGPDGGWSARQVTHHLARFGGEGVHPPAAPHRRGRAGDPRV